MKYSFLLSIMYSVGVENLNLIFFTKIVRGFLSDPKLEYVHLLEYYVVIIVAIIFFFCKNTNRDL